MRSFIASLILLLPVIATGAESILLYVGDMPNRVVRLSTTEDTDIYLNIEGDPEVVQANKRRGITFPIYFGSKEQKIILSTSGPQNSDGSFSMRRVYETFSSDTKDKLGNRVPVQRSAEKLVGANVYGVVDAAGRFTVHRVEGEGFSSEKKKALVDMMNNIVLHTTANKRSVKVGESFRSVEYIQMPVLGHPHIEMEAVSIYRLVKVEGTKAIFDISFEFSDPSSSSGEFKILSEGNGKGQMTFDVANQLMIEERVSSNVSIRIVQGKRIISSKLKSKSVTMQELQNQ